MRKIILIVGVIFMIAPHLIAQESDKSNWGVSVHIGTNTTSTNSSHASLLSYNWSIGVRRNITTEKTLIPELGQGMVLKPYQQPHPPIVVTAVAPFSKGVTAAAARGWEPISANFLQPQWVKSHWPNYVSGCEQAGRPAIGFLGSS